MASLKAVIVGAGRMGGTIDDEMHVYPHFVGPYSHAAGYAAVPEVDLVAFADTDEAKVKRLQERYQVPRGYTDYREMIDTERPDIVSVTTPGTSHAAIVIFAAEHGARGIYCEKALACSLAEADAMVAAVEGHNVKFNMGTLRRWNAGTCAARAIVDSGEIGTVETVITYSVGSLLHSASHFVDLILTFASDSPVEWVQGTILNPEFDPAADRSETDLNGVGIVRFASGAWGYLMSTSHWAEFEVICTGGDLRTFRDCGAWELRKLAIVGKEREYQQQPFPPYTRESSTVRLIRDLAEAVRTDGTTRQGIRRVAPAGRGARPLPARQPLVLHVLALRLRSRPGRPPQRRCPVWRRTSTYREASVADTRSTAVRWDR